MRLTEAERLWDVEVCEESTEASCLNEQEQRVEPDETTFSSM